MSFDYAKVKLILVCPGTKAALVFEDSALGSVDPKTRLSYPIVDDIPRLLVDEASEMTVEDWAAIMVRHGRSASSGELA